MSYPWAPGEVTKADPVSLQLRDHQRQFGPAAIRKTILDLIADFSRVIDDVTIAKKLNVHPAMIAKWRAIRAAEDRAELLPDPADEAAAQMAIYDQIERACLRVVATPTSSDAARNAAIDRLLRIDRQRHERKEALGLVRRLTLPEPEDDAQRGARLLHEALAELVGWISEFQEEQAPAPPPGPDQPDLDLDIEADEPEAVV
jgi:hypothetical protein